MQHPMHRGCMCFEILQVYVGGGQLIHCDLCLTRISDECEFRRIGAKPIEKTEDEHHEIEVHCAVNLISCEQCKRTLLECIAHIPEVVGFGNRSRCPQYDSLLLHFLISQL